MKSNALAIMIKKAILFYIILLFTGCKHNSKVVGQSETKQMKKFEWLPTECAPEHYLMSIYQGDFITEDEQYISIPKGGDFDNGWGNHGSTWVIGEELKPVPVQLKIIWLSYTEKQFYYGNFQLDKEKMTTLFEQGYENSKGQKRTYSTIMVGLAPAGSVSVWLSGPGRIVEIGHFKGEETEVSMSQFKPHASMDLETYINDEIKRFSPETKAILEKEGIPSKKWTNYRTAYTWKINLEHADKGIFENVRNTFYNGEFYNRKFSDPYFSTAHLNSPPKEIGFRWKDMNNNAYGGKIQFDELEIWKAYRSLFKQSIVTTAQLTIRVGKYNSEVEVYLEGNETTIPLKKMKVKLYTLSN